MFLSILGAIALTVGSAVTVTNLEDQEVPANKQGTEAVVDVDQVRSGETEQSELGW